MKWLPLIPLLFLLCQCGTPTPPKCWTIPLKSRVPAQDLVTRARIAWKQMERNPTQKAAADYNLAISQLFDHLHCGETAWDRKAAAMGTQIDRTHTLGTGLKLEQLDGLVRASKVSLKGIGQRHSVPGLGIPLVGWKSTPVGTKRRFEFAPPNGIPLNLTTFLDFSTDTPTWRFVYGDRVPRVKIGKNALPVAIDWSAPGAFYWLMSDLDDVDLIKVFLPTRFTDHAGLFFATPYSKDKIPLVLVHGLNSSPGTYKTLYNDLAGQKWFREKYQALFFSYPTGIAWPYNAAEFRRQMRRARDYAAKQGTLKNWNEMVVVGHSMGGVISHASLIEPGNRFYNASYRRPIGELPISSSTRRAIESVRLYKPLESPSRAIFMAAPHRGSPLADRQLVTWISSIIRLPKTLTIDLATATLDEITKAIQQGGQTRPPQTSIGTLSPNYKPYKALEASPFRPGLVYHSIIGDRGKGDGKRGSDGIVPYWSSHLDGAKSESIVPAGHSLTGHPDTIQEILRILRNHVEKQ
ncbi:MAG: alpha/beta hydrolase [Akkermansiaceae bacterium]|nr:alpha/beta hydrolase [Akkermansiaceae bacterium]